jgi:hypothetical protein
MTDTSLPPDDELEDALAHIAAGPAIEDRLAREMRDRDIWEATLDAE